MIIRQLRPVILNIVSAFLLACTGCAVDTEHDYTSDSTTESKSYPPLTCSDLKTGEPIRSLRCWFIELEKRRGAVKVEVLRPQCRYVIEQRFSQRRGSIILDWFKKWRPNDRCLDQPEGHTGFCWNEGKNFTGETIIFAINRGYPRCQTP